MKRNRAFHLSLDFVARIPGRDASRKVRRVCGEARARLLEDDEHLHWRDLVRKVAATAFLGIANPEQSRG